jgi:ribosomal-protein-alanine N-acetyltransferase
MPAPPSALVSGESVYIRWPRRSDSRSFLAAVRRSAPLHGIWVQAPDTSAAFAAYLSRFAGAPSRQLGTASHVGLIVCRSEDDALVGVFNLSEIVRGAFQSAYIGYYAFAPHAGRGYMAEGLGLTLRFVFGVMRLHRVEINIQPANARSLRLARRAGFTREGFSRRYVKIAGRWRDHERWALTVEDWRARRTRR